MSHPPKSAIFAPSATCRSWSGLRCRSVTFGSLGGVTTTLVVMGVSGSGKTTVATGLAERLGWVFAEGDDFHPRANVEKMRAGIPLTDEDRRPWLAELAAWIADRETG